MLLKTVMLLYSFSEWVPFYYTSSMAIGVLAVVLILLYQARKLLPTGRRNAFYLGIMSTLLGAGSFVVHSLSAFLNSFLQNFGISQEVQNPVSVFVVLGIILLGAGFGYWMVRKYIISEDGKVDVGVAVTCIILLRLVLSFSKNERHPFGNGCSGVLFGCILHDHEDCKENAM
ncbi:unnamed protein product [Lactuca virosa]|uniref:Magnesium transporter n=1 Tax=Lactuca virosa TaxID=75947 RepID=A0AAU9NVN5_9ASTR|nr:unnamed protein product [Lactuca virosa]